jgi:hypothetical protein
MPPLPKWDSEAGAQAAAVAVGGTEAKVRATVLRLFGRLREYRFRLPVALLASMGLIKSGMHLFTRLSFPLPEKVQPAGARSGFLRAYSA